MHAKVFGSGAAALTLVVLLATGTVAFAAVVKFRADLTGGGEVPPVDSKGRGAVSATLDTASRQLTWSGTYSGLTGPVIGAHFHGPVSYVGRTSEQNAPIQVGTPGNLSSGFKGATTITETQAKDLMDGRWYFNLHTNAHQDGEIRGQVVLTGK